MNPFRPVCYNQSKLHSNPYNCNNILLAEAMVNSKGTVLRDFPHGYAEDDHIASFYDDRLPLDDREAYFGALKSMFGGYAGDRYSYLSAENLLKLAGELVDGRLQFIKNFPAPTAARVVRCTNGSSGAPIYQWTILSTLPKNMNKVMRYKSDDIVKSKSGMYDVDDYGRLTLLQHPAPFIRYM